MNKKNIIKLIYDKKWSPIIKLLQKGTIDPSLIITNGNNLGHMATVSNNAQVIKEILKINPSVLSCSNDDGQSSIHLMASYGYIDLLKSCINTEPQFLSLINDAHENVVNILYSNGPFIKYALNRAQDQNLLMNDIQGQNVMSKNIIQSTKINDPPYKIIQNLIHKQSQWLDTSNTFLCLASDLNKPHLVKLFIENDFDPNTLDELYLNPFLYAINNSNIELAQYLIDNGADINYNGPEGDKNPLSFAIRTGNKEIIKLLLDNNFNIDSYNKHLKTPLHYALNKRYGLDYNTIKKLVERGNLNIRNIYNITPLHLLCKYSDFDKLVPILEKKKLDVWVKDIYGREPVDYLPSNKICQFVETVACGYENGLKTHGLTLNKLGQKQKDYKKCKDVLKHLMLETGRSITKKEDAYVVEKRIHLISHQNVNYTLFNSDPFHNMIYTIGLLKKYPHLGIPFQYYFYDKYMNGVRQLAYSFYTNSIHQTVLELINIYIKFFFEIKPYLIIWHNSNVNYVDPNLELYTRKSLRSEQIRWVMFKLTLIPGPGTTHANIIIYDKKNNTLERFEPYGIIPYVQSSKLDEFLIEKFNKIIGSEFKFYGPKELYKGVGLQLISGDALQYMKNLGDPGGFCLAWTFWYLEMRLQNPDIKPDQLVKFCFDQIPGLNISTDPKKTIIKYIRNYTKELDTEKNKFLIEAGISEQNIYELSLGSDDHQKMIKKIEDEFKKIINDRY